MDLFRKQTNIDFMGWRKLAVGLSVLVIIGAVVSLVTKGLNLGIDFTGGTIVEIVLNLNTAGPMLWRALLQQDMYTAGAYIVIIGSLTAVGSLVSDILLAIADPRVRLGGMEAS